MVCCVVAARDRGRNGWMDGWTGSSGWTGSLTWREVDIYNLVVTMFIMMAMMGMRAS